MQKYLFIILILFFSLFGESKNLLAYCESNQVSQLEQDMRIILDADASDSNITSVQDYTVLLEAENGKTFTYSHGDSTPTTSYESASTSKLPSAVIILTLINKSNSGLTLDSKPHDLIDFWTGESVIKLRDLLDFTSGFYYETSAFNPSINFEDSVRDIYDKNINANPAVPAPGAYFHYSGSHLKIAGLMAMKATGKNWSSNNPSEQTIFSNFQKETGLFTHSKYNKPSESNANLAGGMTWIANDYNEFLKALYFNKRPKDGQPLLSQNLWNELFANQRGSALMNDNPNHLGQGSSPLWTAKNLKEDWSYGFGNWLECPTAKSPNSFNCGSGHRNSSAGAYGAYPFIDFDYSYYGIVARQGSIGKYPEGILMFRSIETCARKWAQANNFTPTPSSTPITTSPPTSNYCGPAGTKYPNSPKPYPAETTSFGTDKLCQYGNPTPTYVQFPQRGQTVNWICKNQSGTAQMQCYAKRNDVVIINPTPTPIPIIILTPTPIIHNYQCIGTVPTNAVKCPNDEIRLIASQSWTKVGAIADNCTTAKKCEYYIPQTVPGAECGTANKFYEAESTTFGTDTLCAKGIASPKKPLFPAEGKMTEWKCSETGSPIIDTILFRKVVSCAAGRKSSDVVPGCGTASGNYSNTDTKFKSANFCGKGYKLTSTTPIFPTAPNTSIDWVCRPNWFNDWFTTKKPVVCSAVKGEGNDNFIGAGDYNFKITHDNIARYYLLHIPKTYNAKNSSLILAFHGGMGTAETQKEHYGLVEKSDKEGFIIAFPNGASRFPSGEIATWNAGNCCAYAVESKSDDVGFVKKVIADIKSKVKIDKIYAIGMSNGGMMSYRLACDMSDTFTAIASVAGTDNYDNCNPKKPISIMHIHSLVDTHVLFNGGCGPDCNVGAETEFTSVPSTISKWVTKNNCNKNPERVLDNNGAYCDLYTGCDGNAQVKLCVTDDGGHSWPGAQKSPVRPEQKIPSKKISANDEIWSFFNSIAPASTPVPTNLIDMDYNGIKVKGIVDRPKSKTVDIVLAYHGTTYNDSNLARTAQTMVEKTRSIINKDDVMIIGVMYPEEGLLMGDNIRESEAALLWTKNRASKELRLKINKIYLIGHSQGGYLVTRLNTMHETDGVIANGVGPIDMSNRCANEETGIIKKSVHCNLLYGKYGSALTNPSPYIARSLISFTSGYKSKILFVQGMEDGYEQIDLWPKFKEKISQCADCAEYKFLEVPNVGHGAAFEDANAKEVINNFLLD